MIDWVKGVTPKYTITTAGLEDLSRLAAIELAAGAAPRGTRAGVRPERNDEPGGVEVCHWAARNGYGAVTLTTFRDVRWNLPFYARLGFDVVAPEQVSALLRVIVEDEARRGLDPSCRVVMTRPCLRATVDLSPRVSRS